MVYAENFNTSLPILCQSVEIEFDTLMLHLICTYQVISGYNLLMKSYFVFSERSASSDELEQRKI